MNCAADLLYSTENFGVEIDQRSHWDDTREDETTPILIISRKGFKENTFENYENLSHRDTVCNPDLFSDLLDHM